MQKKAIVIENITFERIGQNQSEITLQHSNGNLTTLLFNSYFPMLAQQHYINAIASLSKTIPENFSNNDLSGIFARQFAKYSLDSPIGIRTSKNEERIRIGKRIKEIREENNLGAKTLSVLTGIDPANLCRIEQGKQSVGIDILSKIANAMGYKIDFVKI